MATHEERHEISKTVIAKTTSSGDLYYVERCEGFVLQKGPGPTMTWTVRCEEIHTRPVPRGVCFEEAKERSAAFVARERGSDAAPRPLPGALLTNNLGGGLRTEYDDGSRVDSLNFRKTPQSFGNALRRMPREQQALLYFFVQFCAHPNKTKSVSAQKLRERFVEMFHIDGNDELKPCIEVLGKCAALANQADDQFAIAKLLGALEVANDLSLEELVPSLRQMAATPAKPSGCLGVLVSIIAALATAAFWLTVTVSYPW